MTTPTGMTDRLRQPLPVAPAAHKRERCETPRCNKYVDHVVGFNEARHTGATLLPLVTGSGASPLCERRS